MMGCNISITSIFLVLELYNEIYILIGQKKISIEVKLMAETLYEKDYVAWLQDQAEKLRSPERNTLDWQTLAEELEEMVDERKYKAESFLIQLLSHLLLYAYWKHPYYLPHWTDEIDNFRLELSLLFRSKVIYNHALERFGYCYQKALGKASRKSGLTLPVDCPWTIEKILDEDWFPS